MHGKSNRHKPLTAALSIIASARHTSYAELRTNLAKQDGSLLFHEDNLNNLMLKHLGLESEEQAIALARTFTDMPLDS